MTDLTTRIEAAEVPDFGYKVEPGFKGIPQHTWWIKGVGGGVHIWARRAPSEGWPTEWIGGVEVHHASCPESSGWFKPDEPSQTACWLLEGPCWHDGTSLYFSERIAPYFRHPDSENADDLDQLPHGYIEFELRDWFESHILRAERKDDE